MAEQCRNLHFLRVQVMETLRPVGCIIGGALSAPDGQHKVSQRIGMADKLVFRNFRDRHLAKKCLQPHHQKHLLDVKQLLHLVT